MQTGRVLPTPKAFPLGERWAGEAGSDEGAILYPTFPCRKEGGCRLSPQRNFSSAPLGNPVAPSSVTSGDSFPPRGSLWVVLPYTKKRPKSGHVDGHRNSPSTGTMRHPTPKRASGNERAIKLGVQGACPRPSFPPFLGRNGGPPPGRRPTGRCAPRLRKSPDHPKGTQYRPPPPRRGLFLPNPLDKGSLIG